ncbi:MULTISPECIES: TIGR04141 family sporadically distributed protein [Aeromonas]|uniref:TIGR04141 family sporadically distributed protein n=1 Tax=Aeromonas caviae TaxID=648 RepID=A0AAJ5Z983_AERCA|nr:TIGR04141 family sporadically distributed protein [Aeromonas caviae]MDX7838270.1 TIGR04141 family sporadically distributed protein [Aeromonas caviae]WFF96496.1 TIGR04141 family sporadically distributed protein [Aeromonas caviae]
MSEKKRKRKEKLSIYLVRDPNKIESEIINTENAMQPIDIELPDIESARLYIKKHPPKNIPPWTRLFTDNTSVDKLAFGTSSSVGAVFIVKLLGNIFILSFGTGFHLLKDDAIERDFGLKVTLNSVDPDKLRSLDKASYDHNPLNSRTQSTIDVDIFNLHLDSETEMLYAITGTSLIPEFGLNVTGRDALTVAVETTLNTLPKILEISLSQYKKKLPSKFSWVENINRVRDLDEIEILDMELDSCLSSNNYNGIWLGEPEIIDWENQIGYSFGTGQRVPRHPVLSLNDYIDHIDRDELTVERMKLDTIYVNNNDYQPTKQWSVYRCIYAEIVYSGNTYILRNGTWYRVNTTFTESIDKYLMDINIYPNDLPEYSHEREEDYNLFVCDSDSSFCLMDKKNIKIGGAYDKIEHCDLIRNGNEFIHVKFYRSSGTLSHLFSQGLVAAEAFIKDAWYREQLNPKLPISIKLDDPTKRPTPSNYNIVYAIATNKNIPNELPFFSKVTLKNALIMLRALDYKVSLAQIKIEPSLFAKKFFRPQKVRK